MTEAHSGAAGSPASPGPAPDTVAGKANWHAQLARHWVQRLETGPGEPADWERTRTLALVSIAESLATIAGNQPQQITAD